MKIQNLAQSCPLARGIRAKFLSAILQTFSLARPCQIGGTTLDLWHAPGPLLLVGLGWAWPLFSHFTLETQIKLIN